MKWDVLMNGQVKITLDVKSADEAVAWAAATLLIPLKRLTAVPHGGKKDDDGKPQGKPGKP